MKGIGSPMGVLAGKVAIVTGGSRGLGREIAYAFANEGASVVIASRHLDACSLVADMITSTTGQRALPVSCHVGRWDDIDQLVERSYAEFGVVDVLVNNAGSAPTYPSVAEVTEDLYDKVLGVNLKGPFRLAALVGTRMAEGERGGSIINISSNAAVRPDPTVIPYAAAKAGLNCMTVGLSHAFGPAVRVNAIMPGRFSTDIAMHWDPKEVAVSVSQYALGRIGEPREIVGAALYFASDCSSYTTGAVLAVDGGIP